MPYGVCRAVYRLGSCVQMDIIIVESINEPFIVYEK